MFKTALLLGVLALFVLPGFAQEEDAKNPPKDQPLKILSKPRPGYTEEARQNNVQGTVKLETTFQSDGKIGDVVCVNEDDENSKKLLKYGLVDNAIAAAKQIKFSPEIKNGEAVTIKVVQNYSFSIY